MRKYWFLFRVALQTRFADRANFYLEMIGNALVTFALIAVWSSVSATSDAMRAVPSATLVLYFVVAGALMGFYRRSQGDEIADDIYRGHLSFWLVKPVHPLLMWLLRDFAIRLIELPFLIGISALLLSVTHVWNSISLTLDAIGWFVFFFLLAACLHFLLFSCVSLLAFWLDHTWGERFVLNVVMEVASGALIPLAFFPPFWQQFLSALPFRHLVATPVELLLGMRAITSAGNSILFLCFWIFSGIFLMQFLWQRGVRRYEGVGI